MEALITATNVSIAVFFTGIVNIVTGFLVYERDSSKQSSFFFLLLAISTGVHAVVVSAMVSMPSAALSAAIEPFSFVTGATLMLFLLLFSLSLFPDQVTLSRRQLFLVVMPYVLLLSTLLIPGYVVRGVGPLNGIGRPLILGPGWIPFLIYLLVYVGSALIVLFQRYRNAAGVFRKQAQYIFIAILAAAVIGTLSDFILVRVGVGDLYWLGPLFVMIVILTIGYFLVKYNFWNIKLVATEFFVSVIYIVLVLEVAFSQTWTDFAIKVVILLLIGVASVMLIQSVKNETEAKEEVERLLSDLEETNEALRFLDKRKSGFVTVAAHHLREPLTAIAGYDEMLLGGSFGEVNDRAKEALQKIFESSKRLVVIINDFMDVSKIEAGTMTYDVRAFDFKKLVSDLVGEMRFSAEKAGLALDFEELVEGYYTITGDQGKIRQVLSNLIDNSIKYTPAGKVSVSLSKDDGAGTVLLRITDTGIGMNKETQQKIFRKFSRAEGVSKVYTEGSGLGLYVAKEIVEDQGGRIWAESPGTGKGSSFYVELKKNADTKITKSDGT